MDKSYSVWVHGVHVARSVEHEIIYMQSVYLYIVEQKTCDALENVPQIEL